MMEQKEKKAETGKKEFMLWGGLFLLAVIIVYGVTRFGNQSDTAHDIGMITEADHVKGDTTSGKPILIEYSDFQCPACKTYHDQILKPLLSEYGDKFVFVYRNFPLRQIHVHAEAAAQSVEAAALQGKFWEMHELLFEKQAEWTASRDIAAQMTLYAKDLDLNVEQFLKDRDSKTVISKIRTDEKSGSLKIEGTPTFFVNGERIENPQNIVDLKKALGI